MKPIVTELAYAELRDLLRKQGLDERDHAMRQLRGLYTAARSAGNVDTAKTIFASRLMTKFLEKDMTDEEAAREIAKVSRWLPMMLEAVK